MLKHFDNTATVTTDLTTVDTLSSLDGDCVVNMEIENKSATVALADFALLTRDCPNGTWHTYISGSTWATTPSAVTVALYPFVSGTPHTLAAASKAYVVVKLYSAYGAQIQAKSASATVSVRVRGSVNC